MNSASWTVWVWWIGGGALLASSVAILVWALFWDRSRKRKRCPRCWYDMSAATSLTCSECGKSVKRETKLYKTRRHKRWALVALVGMLGGGYLIVQPRVKEKGWWSLVSTNVLIAGLPFASDADDFWCRELAMRVQTGTGFYSQRWGSPRGRWLPEMTQAEYAMFFDACVKGDWRARPVSKAWQQKYGDLLDAWLQRNMNMRLVQGMSGAAEEDRLRELPLALTFDTRDPWPTDAQPFVKVRFGCWWPRNTQRRAIMTPRDNSLGKVHVRPTYAASLEIPDFEGAEREFVFDVVYQEEFPGSTGGDWVEISREVKTLVIRREGTTAELLKPLLAEASEALTPNLQLTASMKIKLRNGNMAGIMFNVQECRAPQHEGIAFGFAVDLMRDGEVFLTSGHSIRGGKEYDFSGSSMTGDFDRFREEIRKGGEWEARFRSDAAAALRVFDADRYWVGEFTIPLEIEDDEIVTPLLPN